MLNMLNMQFDEPINANTSRRQVIRKNALNCFSFTFINLHTKLIGRSVLLTLNTPYPIDLDCLSLDALKMNTFRSLSNLLGGFQGANSAILNFSPLHFI